MNTYALGDTITLSTTFKVGGVLTDPGTVSLILEAPDGTETTYTYAAAQIIKDSVGTYHKQVNGSAVGTWSYQWAGTGAAPGVEQGQFRVANLLDPHTNAERYVTLDEIKASASLQGQTYADADLLIALDAASRGLEDAYETLWLAPATDIRYYTRSGSRSVHLGDVQSITEVALDYSYSDVYSDGRVWDWDTGLGSYSTILSPSWYRLLPIQAGPAGNGEPYQTLQLSRASQRLILPSGQDAIRITGSFGWTATPSGVKTAVKMIAERLTRRTREAPFGIIAIGSEGAAIRARDIANDPDIRFVMRPVSGTQSLFV